MIAVDSGWDLLLGTTKAQKLQNLPEDETAVLLCFPSPSTQLMSTTALLEKKVPFQSLFWAKEPVLGSGN